MNKIHFSLILRVVPRIK